MSKRELELPILRRTIEIEIEERAEGDAGDGSGKRPTYPVVFSSELPVSRWFGTEILSHEAGAVDLTYLKKGLSVLANHDPDQLVGICEGELDSGKKVCRGEVQFSESAIGQDFERDVKGKIRRFVSVGYRILKAKLIESSKEKGDTWLATRWMPLEISIASIPADITAGFRSADPAERRHSVEIEEDQEEQEIMNRTADPNPGAPAAPTVADPSIEVGRSLEARNTETTQILELATFNGIEAKVVRGWISGGLSLGQVSQEIIKIRATAGPGQPSSESLAPMADKDRPRYSYVNGLRQLLNRADGKAAGGLEIEVDQELRRNLPPGFKSQGGLMVPMRVNAPETRTLASNAAALGTETVFEQPGELIELLRKNALVAQMGARLLTGLEGPVSFPKQTGAITVQWRGENSGAITPSNLATGQVLLTQKTMQGAQAYTRQLLAQSSVEVESMVRDDLMIGHALALDLAALHGAGSNGEPTGIYQAQDVLSVAMGGVPTYPKVVQMAGAVADANAHLGSLGYLVTPLLASVLKTTARHATAGGVGFIFNGPFTDGEIDGYKARATSQLSKVLGSGADHGMIFGNWNDLILALWGAMELTVDPYTRKLEGIIEVASFQMGDVVLRHGASFCKATGATIS